MEKQEKWIYGYRIDHSNPDPRSSVEYLYDAADFEPGYMDFESGEFVYGSWKDIVYQNFEPVMLNPDGSVFEYLDKDDQNYTVDGNKSHVDGQGTDANAMVRCRQTWKYEYTTFEKSEADGKVYPEGYTEVVLASYKVNDDYTCDVCKDKNGNLCDYWYFPMYDGSNINGVLRSVSGQKSMVETTPEEEIKLAEANGPDWYVVDAQQIHMYCCWIELITKSLDSKKSIGNQYSSTSHTAMFPAGGSMNGCGAFKGYNDEDHPTKALWSEVGTLGVWTRFAGHVLKNGTHFVKTFPPYNVDGEGYTDLGITLPELSASYIKKAARNEYGFIICEAGADEGTFYCDGVWVGLDQISVPFWRGDWDTGNPDGLRATDFFCDKSAVYDLIGSSPSIRK